jgi:hypothetical protein
MKTMDEAITALEDEHMAITKTPIHSRAGDARRVREQLEAARARKGAGHTHEWDRYDITPRAWSGQTPEAMARAFAILMSTVQVSRLEVERMSLIAYAVPNVIVKGSGDFVVEAKRALESVLWPTADSPELQAARLRMIAETADLAPIPDPEEFLRVISGKPTITQEHANRVLMEYPDADLSRLNIQDELVSAMAKAIELEAKGGFPYGLSVGSEHSIAETTDLVFIEMARSIGASRILDDDLPSWKRMRDILVEGRSKSPFDRTHITWGIVDGRFEYSWTYVDGMTHRVRGT